MVEKVYVNIKQSAIKVRSTLSFKILAVKIFGVKNNIREGFEGVLTIKFLLM